MICSISGEKTTEPVVSPKSGAIFEKKHIVNYLSTSGTDPINNEPLTIEELVPIKSSTGSIVPPITNTSIPALLSTFQNEWDALALEVFSLRKQLHKARQELSSALYHQDAAVRVAANAIKERDEAKAALQQLASSLGEGITSNGNNSNSLTSPIPVEEINEAREELFKLHKSIKPTFTVKPDENISIELKTNHGSSSRDVISAHYDDGVRELVVASTDNVRVYDLAHEESFDDLPNDTGITAVNSRNDGPVLASKDSIRFNNSKYPNNHSGDINKIIIHPSIQHLYFALGSDNKWSINSIKASPTLLYISPESEHKITSGDIHVDGALIAIGNNNKQVQIFNTSDGQLISTVDVTYPNVTNIKFALNGYWLLVSSEDNGLSSLDVVDLRKNQAIIHSIKFEGLVDFTIDPSSSLIVTYDTTQGLGIHRYVKKGKQWLDNVTTTSIQQDLRGKHAKYVKLLSSFQDHEFQVENKIDIGVISEDSTFVEYRVSTV